MKKANLSIKIISLSIVIVFILTMIISIIPFNSVDAAEEYNFTSGNICDLNGDGRESTLDALIILKHLAQIETMSEENFKLADTNKDKSVTTIDALIILKRIVGISDEVLTDPVATGSFIQPWLCSSWTQKKWDNHIDMLLSAGIDKLIIQWSVETDNNKFGFTGYDSEHIKNSDMKDPEKYNAAPNMLERALSAAERKGVKVFVGLNNPNDWWDETKMADESWYKSNAEIGNIIMQETFDLYKEKYKNAFYGWYWVCEMYSQNTGLEQYWSKMMNINLDYMTKLDASMPVLFSPFISSYTNITPDESYEEWSNFMKTTNFRKGDIFCPQDSFGASGLALDFLEKHMAAQKKACEFNKNVVFWANCENFTKDGKPAEVSRFIKQLDVASRYAENIITFSYCHYYNPQQGFDEYDAAYKEYVQSVKIKK